MSTPRKKTPQKVEECFLLESAWEVCHQVGGIYTVIKTKAREVSRIWEDNYCLIGPYFKKHAEAEFEPIEDFSSPIGKTVEKLRKQGYQIHYGKWLVGGKPQVVLLDFQDLGEILEAEKFRLWEEARIESHHGDQLLNEVIGFGHMLRIFVKEFCTSQKRKKTPIIHHIHEWMSATTLPEIKRKMKI